MIVRRARVEDAAAIAEVHVETWRTAYAGMLPDKFLLNLSAKKHESRWWRHALGTKQSTHHVSVAEDRDAGVVGFCSGGALRGRAFNFDGEVYALYLLDSFQGIGVGKALFLELLNHLHASGNKSLLVWVLDQNPARFFYESLGGKVVATRDGRVGGQKIFEIGYGWPDIGELLNPQSANSLNIDNTGN
ncbi:MAG: GNAT family N-acetyltransferase [Alphaproteobacteria bacterium]|nr:GNAT family N-acetyltransferase [Alphaproteobacteria bacterium]